ncbi:MAG: hypothetical protein KDB14_19085 [Planctomycetales bacterium]|nr:hypothetical protein [Planctomycetales bacterium]
MDETTQPEKHSQPTVRESATPTGPGLTRVACDGGPTGDELTPEQAKELLQAIEDVEREEAAELEGESDALER